MNLISSLPSRNSIFGRIALCAGAEVAAGMIGAYLGGPLLGLTLKKVGPVIAPIFGMALVSYGLYKRPSLTTAALIGISNTPVLSALESCGSYLGLNLGYWVGKNVGMILGGYWALKWSNCNIPFFDKTELADSYAVGMGKYVFAGEIFNAVVAKAAFPFLHVPINWIRSGLEAIVKSLAYNSSPLIFAVKKLFREKHLNSDVWVPLMVKMACHKYSEQNGVPITQKLIKIVSQIFNVLPAASEKMGFFLRQPYIFQHLRNTVDSLSQKTDRLTIILMRAFNEYIHLISNSEDCKMAGNDPNLLKAALKKVIPESVNLSRLISRFCKEPISQLAESILKALQNAERDLTGRTITNDIEPLYSIMR